MKLSWLCLFLFLSLTGAVQAQTPAWQFRWIKGDKLDYQVEHITKASEVTEGAPVTSASRLVLVKRWTVTDVDDKGVATLSMSLVSLRNEQTRPGGEKLLFDSQDPAKSTPELKDAMGQFIGKTLATLKLDPQGRIREVKEGSTAKYEMEPPFVVVLPGTEVKEGAAWVRPFTLTLDPPLGTGEKLDAFQRYQCTGVQGNMATLAVATQVKTPPESPAEQVPLLQKLPHGNVVFDVASGRLHSVTFSIDRQVDNHQGAGSSYHFQSNYTEQLIVP